MTPLNTITENPNTEKKLSSTSIPQFRIECTNCLCKIRRYITHTQKQAFQEDMAIEY